MKNLIRIAIIMICIVLVSSVFAQMNRIECKKIGDDDNTQCVYENSLQNNQKLYSMLGMPYALCSNAKCTVANHGSNMAVCHCLVFGTHQDWRDVSVGPHDYEKSRPFTNKDKLISVTSNFSLANKNNGAQSHTCQFDSETAWANCFGVRCKVDRYENHDDMMATCHCPIVKSQSFISMGPENNGQCILPSNEVWSAATEALGKANFAVMQDMYQQYYPNALSHK